ncbi:hypothetical protein KKH39_03220 [Patescibacteria group bacterium]|nr:hypothetical protein [Patescibacteria group bacterium]
MANKNIIEKLQLADLRGRGGANFPTYIKWQTVLEAKGKITYILANGSEGEPATMKDAYIIENYAEDLIDGIKIALGVFKNSQAFIYLRKDYFKKYKRKLEKLIGDLPITVVREKGGYLSGEETTACQEIEKKIRRPRLRPPYPGQAGIFGMPTLINNIETFYYISQIAKDKYKKNRFYTILGKVKNKGVFELPINWPIAKILQETGNWPKFEFFLQVGGGASGEILLANETKQLAGGSGSIVVYDKNQTDPWDLMRNWLDFFMNENCDKCTPCREGTYRLMQMVRDRKFDEQILDDLLFVLENTSFCALGKSVAMPFRSAVKKLL